MVRYPYASGPHRADRSVRARANDKDLSNEQALAIAAAEAAAAEHKDGEVDKSLMQEEVDTVDARRSSEFKALPEEIRVRPPACLRERILTAVRNEGIASCAASSAVAWA